MLTYHLSKFFFFKNLVNPRLFFFLCLVRCERRMRVIPVLRQTLISFGACIANASRIFRHIQNRAPYEKGMKKNFLL